ncbi:hypothetical protein ABI_12800 [Asticcacaulis biprosthecium C19]|uniref:Uncharacterized protein n=1 Tax=Asticcacaulis biprosthecium C19 TaxID=715226 RepID=F4QHV6_9CAUL|nr:hypothetical protein ABI_12800 [Asticcacaulis biprosthecium C19]
MSDHLWTARLCGGGGGKSHGGGGGEELTTVHECHLRAHCNRNKKAGCGGAQPAQVYRES